MWWKSSLQSVISCIWYGFGGESVKEILTIQNELLYYRSVKELKIYDDLMKTNESYIQFASAETEIYRTLFRECFENDCAGR